MATELPGRSGEIVSPERLAQIRAVQVQRLVDLKFHELLGVSEDEYRASFPEILPQPETYLGRFDMPLVVDPRINSHQIRAARIDLITMSDVVNTVEVPQTPYTMWVDSKLRRKGESYGQTLQTLQPGEVPGSVVELVALYIQYPDLFNGVGIIAPGSRRGIMPYNLNTLFRSEGSMPGFDLTLDFPNPQLGSLTRGEQINVGV